MSGKMIYVIRIIFFVIRIIFYSGTGRQGQYKNDAAKP